MGTKIQANAFLREYHPVIDLNGSTSNGLRPIYHENQIQNKRQNPDSFTSLIHKNGYLGYEIEKVRQTIIEHESIFRNQLQELHRLYGRQQELMNEIKRREIKKDDLKDKSIPIFPSTQDTRSLNSCEPRLFTSSIFGKGNHNLDFPKVHSSNMETQMQERYFKLPGIENTSSYGRDTKLSLGDVQTSQRNSLKFDLLFKRTNHPRDDGLTLSRGEVSANHCSSFNLVMKDFFQTSPSGLNWEESPCRKEHLSYEHAEKRRFDGHSSVKDFCFGNSLASPQSLLAEPKKELSHCTYMGTSSVSQRKNKIFGIEISEGDNNPFDVASKISSTLDSKTVPRHENHHVASSGVANSCVQNLDLGGKNVNDGKNKIPMVDSSESDPQKCFKNLVDMNKKPSDFRSNQGNPKEGLPWFLKNSQVSGDQSKLNKSFYFMNLDSLQNCSHKFFGKTEIAEGKFQNLKQRSEITAPMVAKKVEMDEKVQSNQLETIDPEVQKGLNNYISNLRHQIDLNLALDEEEALSALSLPTTIVKIATTEIDLEAPPIIEHEMDVSYEECDKIAAEAIIAMSSLSLKNNPTDDISHEPPQAAPTDRLKWFAEIIISSYSTGPHDELEEHVPEGMDYFEFMTLKLKDTKELEQCCYEPVVLKNPNDDENGFTSSKRGRRGQCKRGRQRTDFQKDVLPGLVTLSRLQVTEDFQAFEEMMKADWPSGSSQRGLLRNGRGRKRLGGQNASLTTKAVRSTRAQQPICQLEGRSLTGWGKKTRRLPRQRCANGFVSFAVKC